MQSSLASLLERAGDGDQSAFADFFDLTAGTALRLARTSAPDQNVAEAVLARAYVQAWTQAASFPAEGREALVWLLCIVHEAGRDHRPR